MHPHPPRCALRCAAVRGWALWLELVSWLRLLQQHVTMHAYCTFRCGLLGMLTFPRPLDERAHMGTSAQLSARCHVDAIGDAAVRGGGGRKQASGSCGQQLIHNSLYRSPHNCSPLIKGSALTMSGTLIVDSYALLAFSKRQSKSGCWKKVGLLEVFFVPPDTSHQWCCGGVVNAID